MNLLRQFQEIEQQLLQLDHTMDKLKMIKLKQLHLLCVLIKIDIPYFHNDNCTSYGCAFCDVYSSYITRNITHSGCGCLGGMCTYCVDGLSELDDQLPAKYVLVRDFLGVDVAVYLFRIIGFAPKLITI